MLIAVNMHQVEKDICELSANDDVPHIDFEALLDRVCEEYASGNRCLENILSQCVDDMCPVVDSDYCEQLANKTVARVYRFIVNVYRALDEHLISVRGPYVCEGLQAVVKRRSVYVFKLR